MSPSESRRRRPSRRQASRKGRQVNLQRGQRKPARLALGFLPGAARGHLTRLRLGVLFALSLAAGIALAAPLEERLAGWAQDDLGPLEQMAIQGNSRLSFAEVASTTGIRRGTPLASIDPEAVRQRLAAEPWVREANVLRLPPSTLLVRVEERVPQALLLPRNQGSPASTPRLVDANGHLFAAPLEDRSLPVLVGGDALASEAQYAVLLTGLALFEQLQASELADLWGPEDDLRLHLPVGDSSEGWIVQGTLEAVLGRRDLMTRIHRLGEVMRSDEAMGVMGETDFVIDLRFTGQAVLRREGKANPRRRGRS